jgi:glycyl-tRNA synthetase
LPGLARKIVDDLKIHYKVLYDQQGSIGKRYYRQDEAGTPFCITIDHQSNEDNTVTIRHRNDQLQERVSIENLVTELQNKMDDYS